MSRSIPALLVAAVFALAGLSPAVAHEGHDHGGEDTIAVPAAPRGEASSDTLELVAVAQKDAVVIYLDRFDTNQPVPDAKILVETPAGSVEAKPAGDGSYRLDAPWLARAGRHDLIASVSTGNTTDVLPLSLEVAPQSPEAPRAASLTSFAPHVNPWLGVALVMLLGVAAGYVVGRRRSAAALALVCAVTLLAVAPSFAHEGEDHGQPSGAAPAGMRETAQLLADGSVFVPKSTQRILAIRTRVSASASYQRSVELPGRIIPDPNASGLVQAAVGGRLSAPSNGFPRLGTRVKAGDVLAYVTPPLQAIDVSDMRQRQGELDQQISIVERRLARADTLLPSGTIAKSAYDEIKLELQGLKDRRAALDQARRVPEALVAPVDGIVADGSAVAGQMAQPNAVIFQIIDPSRLWIEALSYEAAPELPAASARIGGKEFKLGFKGAGFADRNQSVPIHFAIEGDALGLRVGQFATVLAQTAETQTGIAVPRTALVRNGNGQDVVFEHITAERFAPRIVKVEPLDGERVLIAQGLEPGRRIVVQGAELVGQIR